MKDLISVDFKRVLRDKLFLVVCIISGAMALFTPLLNFLIFKAISAVEAGEILSITDNTLTARSLFFSSFAPASNVGLILPLFLGIILCKDFSQGTVRGKIVCGKSRRAIFLSTFTVCFTVMTVVIFAHALLTLLVSVCLFPFQRTPFAASDVGYILLSLLLVLILYLFMAAFVSFLCATMRATGLVIVLYLAVTMFMSIVSSILLMGRAAFQGASKGAAASVIRFLERVNVFGYGSFLGQGTEYGTVDLLFYLFTPTLLAVGLLLLGMRSFARKDLK